MNKSQANSAKMVFENHKKEQKKLKQIEKDKEQEFLRDKKNDEYNQKTLQIAKESKNIAKLSLIVAILALISSCISNL